MLPVRHPTETGPTLAATGRQPLFHVKNPVDGGELTPLNPWRIVHLTHALD